MKIIDIKDMPDYNPNVTNGINSVTIGNVSIVEQYGYYSPHCISHGAMLKVSKDGIWRCGELSCNNGCYQIKE